LFGVHPYDLKAIHQMDRIFSGGVPDPHYLKRREAAIIIGVDPTAVSPRSFWADMGAATISNGFYLMFTQIGERFLIETGSEKGSNLISQYAKVRPGKKEDALKRGNIRSQLSQLSTKRGLNFPKREILKLLEQSKKSLIWEEQASKCLSCGSCNMVCPTCYCFDVQDEMELDLAHGERLRRWDGCLLSDFAKVATGENFRETRTARYRHRFFRKGLYLYKVLNDVACVGCGRCSSSCLPDIADPINLFNRLKEDELQGGI
ncbi:MAG: 4Fe-4S dicluster domain-containing protein, partial [Pseudomonadota bacterium]